MKKVNSKVMMPGLFCGVLSFLAWSCGGNDTGNDAHDGDGEHGVDAGDAVVEIVDVPADRDVDPSEDDAADAPADTPHDGEDEDAAAECVYDDTVEHSSTCTTFRVDVARDSPGGLDRTLLTFHVAYPGGDYDRRCLILDSVTVTRGGETVHTGEARYRQRDDAFILEDEAAAGELAACQEQERANVFAVEYHGRSPAGSFAGACDLTHWPPQTTLACHTGLEANLSLFGDVVMVDPSFIAPDFGIDGALGNHGAETLASFSLDAMTWRGIDTPTDAIPLVDPPWLSSGLWNEDPPWEDRVDPGTWQPVEINVGPTEAVVVGGLCSPDDGLPFNYAASHIVITGSHSAGSFEIETHPLYCLIMTP
jgi:hypothetical protein